MHYVYLLQSESFADERYVGMASDLKRRLSDHNSGKSPHTSKFLPWKLVTCVAFSDEQKPGLSSGISNPALVTPSQRSGFGRC